MKKIDDTIAGKIALAGRERVLKDYTWDNIIGKMLTLAKRITK